MSRPILTYVQTTQFSDTWKQFAWAPGISSNPGVLPYFRLFPAATESIRDFISKQSSFCAPQCRPPDGASFLKFRCCEQHAMTFNPRNIQDHKDTWNSNVITFDSGEPQVPRTSCLKSIQEVVGNSYITQRLWQAVRQFRRSELTPARTSGRPASVRNRRRKFCTRSSQDSMVQSSRSMIGFRSPEIAPGLSRRNCRPVQSSNCRY